MLTFKLQILLRKTEIKNKDFVELKDELNRNKSLKSNCFIFKITFFFFLVERFL